MKKILVILLMITVLPIAKAQLSVVNVSVMPYNITPESLLSATIMNQGQEQDVFLVSKLYNLNNDLLITVRSSLFSLKPGTKTVYGTKVASVEYTLGNQSNYIKTAHTLPSGVFKICVEVFGINGAEPNLFCDEIQSDFNQYLYLVYPSDKEVISTTSPVLTWSHSEPFNVLSTGEFFRMMVSEIKENQSSEEAISLNSPVMLKDYVNTHNLQYPYEAKPLQVGKRYAWQVTKIGNGTILNRTETWEFKIAKGIADPETRYFALKKELDGGFYTLKSHLLFFKFQEEYGDGQLECFIYNELNEPVKVNATSELEKKGQINYKQHGLNAYEIDLDDYKLNKGFYLLQVRNNKSEVFVLKFYIE